MVRYYFDSRDNDLFLEDDEGYELPSLAVAKRLAAAALAEIARDVFPGPVVRTLTIELRDDTGPLLRISMQFEVDRDGRRAP